MDKYFITYKLFHNSKNETKLGFVEYNGKRIRWHLENMEFIPLPECKRIHEAIQKQVKEFYADTEANKKQYCYRYDNDTCIELFYKHEYYQENDYNFAVFSK